MNYYKHSPFFHCDAADYLLANGWSETNAIGQGSICFSKKDELIIIKGDSISFANYHDEEEGQRKAEYATYHHITGISDFSIFDWMLVFHVVKVVLLKDFVQKAKPGRAHPIFEDMLNTFFNHHTPAEQPVNY